MVWTFGLSNDIVIQPELAVIISVWDVLRTKVSVPGRVALHMNLRVHTLYGVIQDS